MKKFALLLLFVGLGSFVFAQDDMKPMKYENSSWYRMTCVKYKAGKVGEAKKLIEKFVSAGETAGTPKPKQFWFVTGPYDMLLMWKMEGGPSDLEWKWDADGIKWWKAFIKQEGSEEAANKVQEQYDALVAGSKSEIVRQDK